MFPPYVWTLLVLCLVLSGVHNVQMMITTITIHTPITNDDYNLNKIYKKHKCWLQSTSDHEKDEFSKHFWKWTVNLCVLDQMVGHSMQLVLDKQRNAAHRADLVLDSLLYGQPVKGTKEGWSMLNSWGFKLPKQLYFELSEVAGWGTGEYQAVENCNSQVWKALMNTWWFL